MWDHILLSLNMKSSKNKKTVIFLNKKRKETMINWKHLAYELLELEMNFKQALNDPLIFWLTRMRDMGTDGSV